MDAYTAYMVEYIAQEIKAIEDPGILSIYLEAIVRQRCAIGGANEHSCKNCIYQCYRCRELYQISKDELRMFHSEEETK